jgi:excisionase family DNA binding protein
MDDLLTVNEVEELLKIDRTTVYRMLKDGRLAGAKVGRQWRFPRQAINGLLCGSPAAPQATPADAVGPAPCPDSLPLHCVQTIQDVFADLAAVSALMTAPDGAALTTVSNGCRFCALIQSSPSGRAACRADWVALAARSQAEPHTAICHAGLSYLYSRIDVARQPTTMLLAGQFRQPDQPLDPDGLAVRYDLDPQALVDALTEVPTHAAASATRIGTALRKVADTFTTIAQERAAMIDRLRHIAALSAFE